MLGLLPKTAQITGSVRFHGEELIGLTEQEYAKYRGNKIAMIFQDPLTSLNPVYTVGYQIAEAVLAHNDDLEEGGAGPGDRTARHASAFRTRQQRVDNYPHEMSGGMRQRAVIAIAMANNPDVIIADEPTTALDVTVQAQVLEALEAARAETGAALVLITHDLGVIAGHTDRICVMYAGKLVEKGTVEEVFYRPRMPYTLGLLGSLPRVDEGRPGAAHADRRCAAVAAQPAAGLPVHAALPARPGIVRARGAGAGRRPTARAHLAACHYQRAARRRHRRGAVQSRPPPTLESHRADLEAQL